MDENRRRMSGTEQREIHALFAAITPLKDDMLRERLGQVRYGRRDYAMVIKTIWATTSGRSFRGRCEHG